MKSSQAAGVQPPPSSAWRRRTGLCLIGGLALLVVVCVLRWPPPATPVAVTFDDLDTARIGASPVGWFTISNASTRSIQWTAKVLAESPPPSFATDQLYASFWPSGFLAPGATERFQALVPGRDGARFILCVHRHVPNFFLARKWHALALNHPWLWRVWNPGPERHYVVHESWHQVTSPHTTP